jgi:hypothetical protein
VLSSLISTIVNLSLIYCIAINSDGDSVKFSLDTANAGNTMCLVRCNGCNTSSAFRLYLYHGKILDQRPRVYRIPGLQYEESYRGGVGVVVEIEQKEIY